MSIEKVNSFLRQYGALGTIASWCFSLACAYYGVTGAIVLTGVFAWLSDSLEWASSPKFWFIYAFFVLSLWTFIGIAIMKKIGKVQTVRLAHDYAYSFIIESYVLGIAKFSDDHVKHAGKTGVSIIANIRNVGQGPAKLETKEVRFNLDERTPEDSPDISILFARLSSRGIKTATLPINETQDTTTGSLHIKVIYGPPELEFLRSYEVKIKITILKNTDANNNVTYHLVPDLLDERDKPYVPQ
jgi:hypothetical protein